MSNQSQYLDQYLDTGYTINTFLQYNLRGKAKRYMDKYATALCNSCERAVRSGRARAGKSIRGGVAYYSI